MNVVKFPYSVSRRAHARRPRWSKNGTPEERAAKAAAAAAKSTAATVTEMPRRSGDNRHQPRAPTIVEFIKQLRAYLVQEFARGRDIDQIFGDLEDSYRRVEKALR